MRNSISSVGLEITDFCNLNCAHCYVGEINRPKTSMPYEKITYLIENAMKYNAKEIIISGGEPFIHPDIMKIIDDMKNKYQSANFIITSNGSFVTQKIVNAIKDIDNLTIQISLDGATKETHEQQHGHNTFEHIMDILEFMRDIPKQRKIIRMSISKINYKETNDVIEIAQKFNTRISLSYVCKVGNAKKNWSSLGMTLAQQMYTHESIMTCAKKYPEETIIPPQSILCCPFENPDFPIGINVYTNGDVNICTCLDSEYIIGNAFKESFETFLNSMVISNLSQKIIDRRNKLLSKECKNCIVLNRCTQGCIGRAKQQGDEFGLDGECEYRKAQLFKNLFFFVSGRRSNNG